MLYTIIQLFYFSQNVKWKRFIHMLPVKEIEVNGISNDNHFAFKVFYTMVGIYIHVWERIKYVIFILISNRRYRVCSYHVNHVIR